MIATWQKRAVKAEQDHNYRRAARCYREVRRLLQELENDALAQG